MTETINTSSPTAVARDGRYEGGNSDLFVELRLDVTGHAAVSADVYRTSSHGRDYVASLRSAPGTTFAADGRRASAVWQDSMGATTTGSIRVAATDGVDTVLATLTLDQRLNGLPPGTDLVAVATRAGDELRRLGVEMETEAGVQLPAAVTFGDATLTFRECFTRAGFHVRDVGAPTGVPAQAGGWNLSVAFTVLHDLMQQTAQALMTAPAWELHLLMLATSTREGLLGVMFDTGDVLPRQGAAVFATEIRNRVPAPDQDRKIVQTTVHELGHALNLAHRFERVVGRADSTSFMNYDWRFLGGGQREEYWRRFAFSFDADELDFLRHAPRSALMPGGADFHSVNYWADGSGGYSPYLPEVSVPGFGLALTPPASGPVFAFGQPVFLQVALENRTGSPVSLPPEVLDPKAGFLEVLIRRRTGAPARGLGDAAPFVPIMQRCFDLDATASETLPPGGALRNNLNLTFGASGFAFAEPGEYDVTPLLSFVAPGRTGDSENLVIRGDSLRIRVAHPHDMGQEADATTLFRSDVGAWLALGGSACLEGAGDALAEVRERRASAYGGADPVVAAIVRAAGLHASRPTLRLTGDRFSETAADTERAAVLLGSLDRAALATFDAHTAEHTRSLAAELRTRTEG